MTRHNKLGTKVMYLHIIKSIYDRPTGYDIFSIGTLKDFPLKYGSRQECVFLPHLCNTELNLEYSTYITDILRGDIILFFTVYNSDSDGSQFLLFGSHLKHYL